MRHTGRSRPTPRPCSCGDAYENLRTGMSYREVRRGMDPERWKGRRRAAVLGRWRELKLMMWDDLHRECPEEVTVAPARTKRSDRATMRSRALARTA